MNRTRIAVLPAALALLTGAAGLHSPAAAQAPAPAAPAGTLSTPEAVATITPQDVYARIEFLASDALRGRDTPSRELEIAARYLMNQHRLFGLQPAGDEGGYLQWYPFPLRRLSAAAAQLEVSGAADVPALQLGRDFFSAGGTLQPVRGPLVFAGTGTDAALPAGSQAGRVLVFLLPGGMSRDWRIERNRQRNLAERAGAVAVLHVLDAVWTADSIAKYNGPAQRPARSLGGQLALPAVMLSGEAAGRIVAAGGMRLDDLRRRGASSGFRPVELRGLTGSVALPMESLDQARAPNVVAVLPGSDPALRNEYVVVSAHMDHVGVGQPDASGDSIYNGADDDASGTTALLEVAQAMAQLRERPRRSIIFLHVSGEEKGLLGSEWFSEHPTVPLGQIVANVNVDMIGRNNPDSVVVIGKTYSTLGETTNRIAAEHPELGLTLSDDLWPEERFFFRSDHYNFARKEIPSIFFFSGVHADYHRPSDEVEKIDTDKAARISRIVFYLVHDIANAAERPRWHAAGLQEVRSMTR